MEHSRDKIYVDGARILSTSTTTLPVTNPYTEQVIGTGAARTALSTCSTSLQL